MAAEGVKVPDAPKVLLLDRHPEEWKDEEMKGEEEGFDPYEMADEKDCLSKYNDDWTEKILAAAKWNDKKDMLQALFDDINTTRLKPTDTTSLIAALKKLLTDSNINVFHLSIKVTGLLSKGLRQNFREGAKQLASPLMKRFAEKRPQIISDISSTLAVFLVSCPFNELLESAIVSLSDKNPNVVKFSTKFIDEGVKQTYIDELTNIKNDIIPVLMGLTNHSDSEVRDAILESLGLLKGRLGETIVSSFLKDLNTQKMAKVNESAAKYEKTKYD